MNTSKTPRTQKLLVVSLFAAFAAQALPSLAADGDDTQTRVRSVLEGRHAFTSDRSVARQPAPAWDVEAYTRRVLLGSKSAPAETGAPSVAVSIGSNGISNSEAQTLTQRVVLGRSAS